MSVGYIGYRKYRSNPGFSVVTRYLQALHLGYRAERPKSFAGNRRRSYTRKIDVLVRNRPRLDSVAGTIGLTLQ